MTEAPRHPANVLADIRMMTGRLDKLRFQMRAGKFTSPEPLFTMQRIKRERQALWGELPALRLVVDNTPTE